MQETHLLQGRTLKLVFAPKLLEDALVLAEDPVITRRKRRVKMRGKGPIAVIGRSGERGTKTKRIIFSAVQKHQTNGFRSETFAFSAHSDAEQVTGRWRRS